MREGAGWPRVIAHPGLPQIRTCRITASGSSNDNFASHTITRRESGLLSAGVASTWDRSSEPPPRVLPAGLSLGAPLPSSGSSRSSSPTSTVLSGRYDFLPPISPHFVAFAWRYHGNTRGFAPIAAECYGDGPGVGHPVAPSGISSMETTGSPTFLGDPLCLCPALRPRQDRRARPLRHANMAPALTTTKAPALQLSRLNHTASALAVYASQHGLPHDHARLASGCRPSSTGRDFHPQGSNKRFQTHIMCAILLFQAFVAQGQAFTIHFEAKKAETGDITGCGLPRYVPKCKVKA